jgi:hypothetical protein
LDESTVTTLLQLAEPLVALSITHLTPATRAKLAADDLSINAYPSDYGGLVYVGAPPYRPPTEVDLTAIFKAAAMAGIVWLKFDADAPVVDGLSIYDDEGDAG